MISRRSTERRQLRSSFAVPNRHSRLETASQNFSAGPADRHLFRVTPNIHANVDDEIAFSTIISLANADVTAEEQ